MRLLDYDLIFLALPRWDGPYSSTAYSLAKALSKHTRVFYVDNPFTVKDFLVHRRSAQMTLRRNALLKGKDLFFTPDKNHPNLITVTPRLTLPINWLPSGWIYDSFSRFNDYTLSVALNETFREYSIEKYILINSFNPLYGRFLNLKVKPTLNIYQSVDDISHSSYVNRHGPRLEEESIGKADFTIVTSSELQRLKSSLSEDVFLLPNAANTAIFHPDRTENLDKPREIADLPPDKKIICYMGNICHRLDYELLTKVATRHPDKVLLMVGPFATDQFKTSGLAELPNVRFTGRKLLEELPPYVKYSHCCIIPFVCNELTKSIYPLKINEYLAAGKPVVSTCFSQDIASFNQVAYISSDHEEFISNIDVAIAGDSAERAVERVNFSSGNTWESRAIEFIELVSKYMGEGQKVAGKVKRKAGARPISQ